MIKQFLVFILLSLTNSSFSQTDYSQVFDDLLVRDMKLIQDHYLLHLDHLMNDELKEYIVNCDKKYCMGGLGYMDSSFNYEWIYVPEKGGIEDFWENSNYIYLLNSSGTNSKINSSAALFLLKLNKKGKLVSEEKIDDVEFDQPNGRFEAMFDKNGLIWKITDIPQGFTSDYSKFRLGKPGKLYVIEALDLNLEKKATYTLNGDYLYFEAFDSKKDESAFVFSSKGATINDKALSDNHNFSKDIPSILLLKFNSSGEFITSKYLGSGHCGIEDIKYQGNNLIIAGSYAGNDSISDLPDFHFQKLKLRTPQSYLGNGPARNSFIASIDSSLNLNWFNPISGTCDILFNSLSTTNAVTAISFNYKDSVNVDGKTFYSLKSPGKYQYVDPIICFLDANGKLTTHEQMECDGSGWNNVFLFPNYTAIHGTFYQYLKIYDHKLESQSKNSVYYLTFIKNKGRVE